MNNLIKKELIISLRTMGIMALFILAVQFITTFYINKDVYEAIADKVILNDVLVSTIMFFPIMLIPLIGVVLISAVATEEKKEKIVQILFANGVSAQQMWRSRIIAATSISYIGNFVGIIISLIYVRIAYNMWLNFDIKEVFNLFLLIPLVAIAVVNIICLLMWISKTAQSFVAFIPAISYIGFTYLISVHPKIVGKLNDFALACIILAIVLFVIIGCDMIAKKINKEYLVNIHS